MWAGKVNRKPKVIFSVGFSRFFPTKNRLFSDCFSVAQKVESEKPTRFFRSVLFYSPQQPKYPTKPTEVIGDKTKTDRAIFIFWGS